ncbi:MAG: glutamate--tRNA ligase family protein [Desulfobacterales bacterium]|nr:glutamate--tRNA ligase family protein [Desulfobacterales bacterium]
MHGDITFDNAHIEDFVALRSDGHPTYHLSVVADDIDMAITHVVRGDDHISNTPKQVLLYRAFGKPLPAFAHVPLILGPDKRRLSKRHGATSVTEYSTAGLPARGDDELPRAARLVAGQRPGAVLARRARGGVLARGHQQQQRRLQPREARVVQRAAHRAHAGGGAGAPDRAACCARPACGPPAGAPGPSAMEPRVFRPGGMARRLVELLRPRAKRLTDFVEKGRPFLVDEVEHDADAVKKHLSSPDALAHLAAVRDACAAARGVHRRGARAGHPRARRGARREGRRAHPPDARGGGRPRGKPRHLRGAGVAGPGAGARPHGACAAGPPSAGLTGRPRGRPSQLAAPEAFQSAEHVERCNCGCAGRPPSSCDCACRIW